MTSDINNLSDSRVTITILQKNQGHHIHFLQTCNYTSKLKRFENGIPVGVVLVSISRRGKAINNGHIQETVISHLDSDMHGGVITNFSSYVDFLVGSIVGIGKTPGH